MANDWETTKKMIDNTVAFLKKKSSLELIGKYNETTIRKRTLLGKGVDTTGGAQTKLQIKSKTKTNRRILKRKGELSGKTQPAKANLTKSGKMLDSLTSIVRTAQSEVITQVSPENQAKANALDKMGHKFLNLTNGEIKGLVELLVKKLLGQIK